MLPSKGDAGRRLSVGAAPRADESLPGFAMRLAARARFASADKLAAMAGLRQPGSAVTDADLSTLAELAGTTEASLAALAYRPTVRLAHQDFLGGVVSREFIRLDTRRFCPACLAQSLHHRARWDLALMTACHEHGVRLVERCPRCNKRVGWRNPAMGRCGCGAGLLGAPAEVTLPREAYVAGRLVDLLVPSRLPWLAAPLAACGSADLLRLLMCLGMFLAGWSGQRRIEALIAAGPDAVARMTAAGMQAFEDWPASVHGFLAEQGASAGDRRGRYGARKSLGAFYEWLTLMEAGPVKDALAQATAGFVARDPELSRRTHRSKLLACGDAAPALGLLDAAGMLRTTGTGVRRMMTAGLLPDVASEGRGVPMLLSRSSVERLATLVPSSLNLAETAAALDISKARVRVLVEGDILRPVHQAASEGWGRWAFVRADVLSLPDRLAGKGMASRPGRTVGFDAAAEALRRRGIGLAAILARVGIGELPVCLRDRSATGLKQLRFSASGLRGLCRALEDQEYLTLQAAAERMALKWEVVANLVGRGLLPTERGQLTRAGVDGFLASHVTGGQLAREQGTSPRALARKLDSLGVRPVVGPGVDGSRQHIYARASVFEKWLNALDF